MAIRLSVLMKSYDFRNPKMINEKDFYLIRNALINNNRLSITPPLTLMDVFPLVLFSFVLYIILYFVSGALLFFSKNWLDIIPTWVFILQTIFLALPLIILVEMIFNDNHKIGFHKTISYYKIRSDYKKYYSKLQELILDNEAYIDFWNSFERNGMHEQKYPSGLKIDFNEHFNKYILVHDKNYNHLIIK